MSGFSAEDSLRGLREIANALEVSDHIRKRVRSVDADIRDERRLLRIRGRDDERFVSAFTRERCGGRRDRAERSVERALGQTCARSSSDRR